MSNNSYYNDQWRIINEPNQNKVSNYSCEFDGTNDKIEFGNVNNFERTDSFSFSVWVNIASYATYYYISKQLSSAPFTGYILFSTSDGKLQFLFNNTFNSNTLRVNSTSQIPLNQWVHLTLTYDGSSLASGVNMYLNGVPETIITVNNTLSASTLNTTDFQISGRDGGNGNIVGKVDQVSIFDYELSATEVSTLYGGGTAITNPMALSPITYYQLGDQSVDNGANYLVPNNSLQDYVFFFPLNTARISVPSRTNSSTATVSFWINYDSLGTGVSASIPIGGDTTTFWPYIQNSSGKFHFYINSLSSTTQDAITTVDVVLNKWFHIALSDDGTNTKAYINGVPQVTMTSVVNALFNTIGAWSSGSFSIDGRMSNVAYWQNTNLSDAQILSIYNNGVPNDISSLNPTSWWKLNAQDTFDGTNWTINDYAGSNDGTSVAMTSANLVQSNLQQTSGYSPYALDFSGITASLKTYTTPAQTNIVTLSAWVKRTGASGNSAGIFGVRNVSGPSGTFGVCWDLAFLTTTNKIQFRIADTTYRTVTQNDVMPDNTWTHVVGIADGTNIKLYINAVFQTDIEPYSSNLLTPTSNIFFAAQGPAGSNPFNGQLLNCARWNIGLTQAQVTEIFNSGRPSNLNTFSGTAPIGWWQIGSNSSFEGNDWTCLDEIGTDYADSHSTAMANDDIVNGPGYSGSGLGTSSIDIVGDAPYSTANGLSENMDVLDRSTDVPS